MSRLLSIFLVMWLGLAAYCDDRSEIQALFPPGGWRLRPELRVVDGWSVCGIDTKDSAVVALVHRMDGRWRLLVSSGGVLDWDELYQFGLPRRLLGKFGTPPAKSLPEGPYWKAQTAEQDLTSKDLPAYHQPWILALMRNEIYARHGRPFQDPTLRGYFRERSWYHERSDFRDTDLSPRERRNVLFLLRQEQRLTQGLTG